MSEIQVDQFFRADGSLTHIPAKASRKIAVLEVIAQKLNMGQRYSERELNEIILEFHSDTAALRRHMVEFKILERDRDSNYWLAQNN